MENVPVPNRKLFAPLGIGIAIFGMQFASPLSTTGAGLMIALAGTIHMTAMALRDAEFREMTTHYGLNAKDCFAYGCMVLYDAILLFGLVTGAGLLMPWSDLLSIACLIVLIMPVVVFFLLRRSYDPATARDTSGIRHWMPPLLLGLMVFAFWGFGSLQNPTNAQPYFWLVLFSANLAATDPRTRFESKAQIVRYGLLAGLVVILIWDYLT